MEKSLGYGFEYYMDLIPGMKQADPKASSSIVLAYIGDCVFDLIIKMRVVGRGGRQVHKLHEETSRYVQASAQSFMMRTSYRRRTCGISKGKEYKERFGCKKSVDHRLSKSDRV